MKIILGVDPGIYGGLAVVDEQSRLIDVIDIPVAGVKAKERVDVHTIHAWLIAMRPTNAFIERAQAMPKQGASSGFKYGRAVGAIESAIILARIPLTIIEPKAWKQFHKLPGKEKEASRLMALQMFPGSPVFARKKDHGRAEAALIAMYGLYHQPKEGELR